MSAYMSAPSPQAKKVSPPLAWLPQFLWLIILLRTASMLPPETNPVNFEELKSASFAVATASSDAVNQLFWAAIAACVSVVVFIQGSARLKAAISLLPLLAVFLAFCLVSAIWATHPDISLRRSIFLIVGAYCTAGAVVYCRSSHEVLRATFIAFSITLFANLASMAFPFAFDARGLFRGVSGDKNFLGVLAVMGIFIGLLWHARLRHPLSRILNGTIIAAWFLVLVITGDKTAIILALLVPLAATVLVRLTRGLQITLPLATLAGVFLFACVCLFVTVILGESPNEAISTILPDATFTGRDVIWEFIIRQWQTKWLLGFGYGSFWGVGLDAPNLQSSHSFIQVLTEAHNGYLDVALAVGLVGTIILCGFLGQLVVMFDRIRASHPSLFAFSLSLLLFLVLHNLTESSLARGIALPWIMMMAACFLSARAVMESEAPLS